MAYVGNQPAKGQFRKLTDISGSFDGVTTTFTTSVPPGTSSYYVTAGSASQLLVSLGGVIQQPDTDYTVSTNSITFTTAPASGLSFFGVLMGDALNTGTPADGSVTTSKLASDLTVDLASGSASTPSLTFDLDTGLFSPGSDSIAISTGGTQRATVDSSGRLLVGTTTARSTGFGTPQYFQEGVNRYESIALCVNESIFAGRAPVLQLARSRGGSLGSSTIVNNGDALGFISFFGADGTDIESGAATIACEVDGTPGANDMPGRLVFSTTADGASSPTERMRIGNDGESSIYGQVSVLNCRTASTSSTADVLIVRNGASSTTTGTIRFSVKGDGDCENTNNSYGALSDIKLKENIADANSQWSDIKALQVRKYNFKPETGHGTHTQIGLVAQEVELVSPGLVSESPDRDEDGNDLGTVTKSVNYSVLYMKAVKALQEAMERIETLEAKVAALESA